MSAELLPGDTVRIGGAEYVMPPLNLRGIKRAIDLIPKLESDAAESVDACIEVVLLALRRNYPALTIEQLEEEIDLETLARLTALLLAQLTGARAPAAPDAPPPEAPPLELAAE